MNAIQTKNLCKRYPDFSLDNITLSLPGGTVLGLVGENGAGKTTLIRLLMNAAKADGGSATVLGVDRTDPAFSAVKEEVGVVLDTAYFPEVLSAQNVNAVMKYTYKNWDEAQYNAYLKRFDLPVEKQFKDYSRGMKMKLAIAVALSHAPRLLVLDEATGGLDPMAREEILDIFNEFTRDENHSILLSSHIVSDLEKICDYIACIHKGKLLFCTEKDVLLEKYAVLHLTRSDFDALPAGVVKGEKSTPYGVEVLLERASVPKGFTCEHTTLEEIILFLTKGVQEA